MILLEASSALSAANATRAHSTVGRQLVEVCDGAVGREALQGEVETRLRERGWRGVIGAELDRLRALRLLVLPGSPPSASRFDGDAGAAGLAASPSALSVALMTSVASVALSLAESSPTSSLFAFLELPFGGGAPATVVDLDLLFLTGRVSEDVDEVPIEIAFLEGVNKDLRATIVADEQVEMLEIELRIASAWDWVCVEAMAAVRVKRSDS